MKYAPGIRYALLSTAAVALLAFSGAAPAAADAFLKLDGINRESTDARHKNEIDVLSWSGGLAGVVRGQGRRNNQDLCVQDLAVTKYLDSSSPLLHTRAATGTPIATAKLSVRRAGESQQDYLVLEMTQVLVSSIAFSGSSGADRPVESVTLNFATIKVSYSPQKPDGSLDSPIVATYPGTCR